MTSDESMTIYHQLQQIYVLLDDGDRRTLREVELTPTQYNLLLRLDTDVKEGLTVTELANLLLCSRGNITRLVRRLEQQGLVQTGGDSSDQRLVRIALTPEGAARRQAALEAHTASVRRRLGALPPATRRQLATLTGQVVDSLTADLTQQRE